MCSKHVIPAAGLDVDELIFGRHFANGSQLDVIGLAVERVVEEILEVAHALGLDELIAHCLDVFLMLGGVGHIEDEACVRAVGVVRRRNSVAASLSTADCTAPKSRQAVHLLLDVRLT